MTEDAYLDFCSIANIFKRYFIFLVKKYLEMHLPYQSNSCVGWQQGIHSFHKDTVQVSFFPIQPGMGHDVPLVPDGELVVVGFQGVPHLHSNASSQGLHRAHCSPWGFVLLNAELVAGALKSQSKAGVIHQQVEGNRG